MTKSKRRNRRWSSEKGAELIEFALVFPILLMVVLGCVDFAFVFHHNEVVTNAAREGARVATLPGYITSDIEDRVNEYLAAGGLPTSAGNPVIAVTAVTIPSGVSTWPATQVDVTYTHDYLFIGGIASWFGGGGSFTDVTLAASATMRNELGS